MDKYTILCTEAQTKKALELGAPIDRIEHHASIGKHYTSGNNIYDDGICYFIPTAKQMCGWLRTKGINFHFDDETDYWGISSEDESIARWYGHSDKKELKAIDAALEYLSNKK